MEETNIEQTSQETNNEPEHNEENESESRILEFFEYEEGIKKPNLTEKLILLNELTKIDKELAEIDEEKGDLPDKIKVLTDNIDEIERIIQEDSSKIDILENEKQQLISDNKTLEEKMSKYDELKYNAKSNKEYDDIIKSIDGYIELIEKNEKRIKEIESQNSFVKKEIDERNAKNEENKKELEENKELLNELNTEFEDEEKDLTEKRNIILEKIDPELISFYERINHTLKGEATAIVRKGNCSGCYNSVPPQRVIEIKMAEKIYSCQSCGRILIDESIVSNI